MVETRAVRRAKALLEGIGEGSKTSELKLEGDLECYSLTYRRRKVNTFRVTPKQVSS